MPAGLLRMGAARSQTVIAFVVGLCAAGTPLSAPDPLPAEIFPKFARIHFSDGVVVLSDDWNRTFGIGMTDWVVREEYAIVEPRIPRRFQPLMETCDVPEGILRQMANIGGSPRIAICLEEDAWISSGAFCSEGPEIHARLFHFDKRTSTLQEYPDVIPECEAIAAATRIGRKLVLALHRPEECAIQSGSGVLIWEPDSDSRTMLPPLSETQLDASVFVGLAYHAESNSIWAATYDGIHRWRCEDGAWESRYFDLEISDQEGLLLRLSTMKPPVDRIWMAHHLYYYPIEKRRDFAAAWKSADLRAVSYAPAFHPALTPFYLDAIRNLAGTPRDAQFERLMRLVAENEDSLPQVRILLDDLYFSSLTSQQRAIVARNRLRLGVSDSRSEMTDAFETLRSEYFETLAPDPLALRRFCDFTFRDADLIRRISQRLNEEEWTARHYSFMATCVVGRLGGEHAEFFLPALRTALSYFDSRSLHWACSAFRPYAHESLRHRELVLPVLKARLAQAELEDPQSASKNCRSSSYWIANSADGIDEILSNIGRHAELHAIAQDVLSEVTGQTFADFDQWRAWWEYARSRFVPSLKINGPDAVRRQQPD